MLSMCTVHLHKTKLDMKRVKVLLVDNFILKLILLTFRLDAPILHAQHSTIHRVEVFVSLHVIP